MADPGESIEATDSVWVTQYDAGNLVTSMIDPLQRVTKYTYDGMNRLVQTTFPETAHYVFEQEPSNVLSNLYEALAKTTDSTTIEHQYDANGNLIETTNELGAATKYQYSGRNLLEKLTLPDHRDVGSSLYASGGDSANLSDHTLSEYFSYYDTHGNLIQTTDARGNSEYYELDALGRTVLKTFSDPGIHPELEGVAPHWANFIQYVYNDTHDLIQTTDALHHSITDETIQTGTNQENSTIARIAETEYDGINRPIALNRSHPTDGIGFATSAISYDGNSNITQLTDAENIASATEFDSLNHPVYSTTQAGPGGPVGLTTPEGAYVVSDYASNLSEVTNFYNEASEVVKRIESFGSTSRTSELLRDKWGQVDQAIAPEVMYHGNLENPQSNVKFDRLGNVVLQIDAEGNEVALFRDQMNRVIAEVSDHPSDVTAIDLSKSLEELRDTGYTVAEHFYDKANRLIQTITQRYDMEAGVRKLKRTVTHHLYDAQDRLYRSLDAAVDVKTGGDSPARPEQVVKFDANSNQVETIEYLTDEIVREVNTTYDKLNRPIVTEINPDGEVSEYRKTANVYDIADRLVKTIDPLGRETEYIYDNFDRVVETVLPSVVRQTADSSAGGVTLTGSWSLADLPDYSFGNQHETSDTNATATWTFQDFTSDLNHNLDQKYELYITWADLNGVTSGAEGGYYPFEVKRDGVSIGSGQLDQGQEATDATFQSHGKNWVPFKVDLGEEGLQPLRFTASPEEKITVTLDVDGISERMAADAVALVAYKPTEKTEYDTAGFAHTQIDTLGRQTKRKRDILYRTREMIAPIASHIDLATGDSVLDSALVKTTYNGFNHVTQTTDPLGRDFKPVLDKLDRTTQTESPAPHYNPRGLSAAGTGAPIEKMEYDLAGNIISKTDANGDTYFYKYDKKHRLVETIHPRTNSEDPLYQQVQDDDEATQNGTWTLESGYHASTVDDSLLTWTFDNPGSPVGFQTGVSYKIELFWDATLEDEANPLGKGEYTVFDEDENVLINSITIDQQTFRQSQGAASTDWLTLGTFRIAKEKPLQ